MLQKLKFIGFLFKYKKVANQIGCTYLTKILLFLDIQDYLSRKGNTIPTKDKSKLAFIMYELQTEILHYPE